VGETVLVREKLPEPKRSSVAAAPDTPASVIIIGGGGAGRLAAADMLRREGQVEGVEDRRSARDRELDETLEETFPASDAPANTAVSNEG
jgi:shikimate 5-dehydrogenase